MLGRPLLSDRPTILPIFHTEEQQKFAQYLKVHGVMPPPPVKKPKPKQKPAFLPANRFFPSATSTTRQPSYSLASKCASQFKLPKPLPIAVCKPLKPAEPMDLDVPAVIVSLQPLRVKRPPVQANPPPPTAERWEQIGKWMEAMGDPFRTGREAPFEGCCKRH